MANLPDLIVRYEREMPEEAPSRIVVTKIDTLLLGMWQDRIEHGDIHEVILVGPATLVHGWRLEVDRPVKFMSRLPVSHDDMIHQAQAEGRIVELGRWRKLITGHSSAGGPTTGRIVSPFVPPMQRLRPLARETADKLAELYRESYPEIRRKWLYGDWGMPDD